MRSILERSSGKEILAGDSSFPIELSGEGNFTIFEYL